MKIDQATIQSFSERRKIIEEIERLQIEGVRVDVADLCVCKECGGSHYKPRVASGPQTETAANARS